MKKNLSGNALRLLIILIGSSLAGSIYAKDIKVMEYQAAEAELKNIQKQLIEKLSTKDKENLRESQRQWNMFRNVDCTYEGADTFGCLGLRTKERTQHLKDRLENRPLQ
ncbi:MAG: lysozyme inhibitor LprI family protein [Nitrosospira sp.]|nr:lysozyme inhibitor LprI family protein [Nitrosospira sp.]